MNEISKSSLIALAISIPVTLIGAGLSFALAHSSGFIFYLTNILFAPFLLLSHIVHNYFESQVSDTLFNILAILSQFIGYFIVVFVFRLIYKKSRKKA